MRFISHLVLLLSCLLCGQTVFSQSVIGKKLKLRPSAYFNSPTGEILGEKAYRDEKMVAGVWVVFSDRDNNQCYNTPDLNSPNGNKLPFRKALYVIDETDSFVHVVEHKHGGYEFATRTVKLDLVDYGWLPKSHAILWTKGLVDPITRFTRKCIAVNTIETLNDIEKYAADDKLLMYTSPGGSQLSDCRINLHNFVFVYEEYKGYLLLGKDAWFDVGSVNSILGWVKADIVQQWSHRVALEPNTEQGLEERKIRDVEIKLFATERDALDYANGVQLDTASTALPFSDKFQSQYAPEWKRFPVLSKPNEQGVFQTGVITPVFNSDGEVIIDTDEQIVLNKKYEDVREKTSRVNVVFVVDGSESMRQFTMPICKSIRDATAAISESASASCSFEYGAVLYRANDEKACGNPVFIEEALSANPQEVINFLQDQLRLDCSKASDVRALYVGMDAALNMFKKKSQANETNVVVLIAGPGNDVDDNSVTMEMLVKKFADTNASLMAFQSKSAESPSYNKLVGDLRDIMFKSEVEIQKSYKRLYPTTAEVEMLDSEEDEALVRMNYPKSAPVPGYFVWTPPNTQMSSKRLKEEIEKIILESIENNERLFSNGDAQIKGVGRRFKMDEATRNFLSKMDVKVDLLQRASQENVQFFMKGYSTLGRKGLRESFFSYVILLEDEEYGRLLYDFSRLLNPGIELTKQREEIESMFRQLASTYIGQGESKDIVRSMSIESVLEKMFGLPGANGIPILKMKIEQIQYFSVEEVQEINEYFRTKQQQLIEYRSPENSFTSGGGRYYWVPQRILP